MMREPALVTFSALHGYTVLGGVLVGILAVLVPRYTLSQEARYTFGKVLALTLAVLETVNRFGYYYWSDWVLKDLLPLHICGAGAVMVAIALWFRIHWVFGITYFWGLGGATLAFLTPTVQVPFPGVLYFTYFIIHGIVIFGPLYMIVNYGWRPDLRTFGLTCAFTFGFLVVVGGVNALLGTNYLFICEKPPGNTPFNLLGPWPWYIGSMCVVAFVMFCVVYSPFAIYDGIQRLRRGPVTEPATT